MSRTTKFKCDKCVSFFTSKVGLNYHISKNVCEKKSSNFSCPACAKKFTSNKSLQNHCNYVCNFSMVDKVKCKLKNERLKNNKLKKENIALKKRENDVLKKNICNTITNSLTINVTPIVKFGEEDYKRLTIPEIVSSLNSGYYSVQKIIENMHFNDRLLEYQNVEFNSLNGTTCQIYNGKMWATADKGEIIGKLVSDKIDIVDQIIEANNEIYSKVRPHTKLVLADLVNNGYVPEKELEIKKSINGSIFDHTKYIQGKRKYELLNLK